MAAFGSQVLPFGQQHLLVRHQPVQQVQPLRTPNTVSCNQRWKLWAAPSKTQSPILDEQKLFCKNCIAGWLDRTSISNSGSHPLIQMSSIASGSTGAASRQVFTEGSTTGVIKPSTVEAEDAQLNPRSQDLQQISQDMEELKEELEELSQEIIAMYKDGDVASAVELADANLEAVEDQMLSGVVGVEQVAMLVTLSWTYHLMELPKGTAVLEQLLQVLDKVKEGRILLPDVLFSAAQQSYALERKEEAVVLLRSSLAIQDSIGVMDSLEPCVNVVERLALVYIELDRAEEAVLLLRTWMQKLQKKDGMDAFISARLNTILARCNLELGDLDSAEYSLSRAVSGWEKAKGKDALEVGLVLIEKGDVLYAKGKISTSQSCLELGIRILEAKSTPGEDGLLDSNLGESYRSLLEVYKYINRKDLAHEMLNRAVARLATSTAPMELPLVNLYLELAEAHLHVGLWPVVERLCEQVLVILNATLPPDSVEVTKPLELLSECFLREGRLKDARGLAEAHLQITRQNYPSDHILVGLSNGQLGRVLCKLREWDEAEPYLRAAVSSIEAEYGPSSLALLSPVESLAEALRCLGEPGESLRFQKQLEQIREAPENFSALGNMTF